MLKLILAPDLYRFLLKMNFISKVMAKTSVINTRVGESPAAQTVLLATHGGSRWILAQAPPSALWPRVPLLPQLPLEDGAAGWWLHWAQTVLEAKGLSGNLHSGRTRAEPRTATQVMLRCNPIYCFGV